MKRRIVRKRLGRKKSGPIVNGVVEKIHTFIEEKIVDIPDLTPEQKQKLRQYSLELVGVIVESAIKGLKESYKEELKDLV